MIQTNNAAPHFENVSETEVSTVVHHKRVRRPDILLLRSTTLSRYRYAHSHRKSIPDILLEPNLTIQFFLLYQVLVKPKHDLSKEEFEECRQRFDEEFKSLNMVYDYRSGIDEHYLNQG